MGCWNYHRDGADEIGVTYWMKRLQALPADRDWCVTLNRDARIDPARVAWSGVKEHPLFTREGIAAQGRRDAISGRDRTFYCGAYWGYGFHEDGVRSALAVTRRFGLDLATT
jgi:predicted NAD/FAD-binding protein